MIAAHLLVALTLSQEYVRTKVNDADPNSSCQYWKENQVITYQQSKVGNPKTTDETEFTAVKESFDAWQAEFAACGSLTLVEGERTSDRSIGYSETGSNVNVILFRQKLCSTSASGQNAVLVPGNDSCWNDESCGSKFDCWDHSQGALAITTTSYAPKSGKILDGDIELNSQFEFTTVDLPPCPAGTRSQSCVSSDLRNTMTHEIGHFLGLAHSPSPASTMFATANPGETNKRTLDNGSKAFVCEVYPKGKLSRNCVTLTVGSPAALGKPYGGCSSAGTGSLVVLLAVAALRSRRRR